MLEFDVALIRLFKSAAPVGGYVSSSLDVTRRWQYGAGVTLYDLFGIHAPITLPTPIKTAGTGGAPPNVRMAYVDYANNRVLYYGDDNVFRVYDIAAARVIWRYEMPTIGNFIFGSAVGSVLMGFARINGAVKIILVGYGLNFVSNLGTFRVAAIEPFVGETTLYTNEDDGKISAFTSVSPYMLSTAHGAYFGFFADVGGAPTERGYIAYGFVGNYESYIRRLCRVGGDNEAPVYCLLNSATEGLYFPNPPITSATDPRGTFLTRIDYGFDKQYLSAWASGVSTPVIGRNIQMEIFSIAQEPKAVDGIVELTNGFLLGQQINLRVGGTRIADDGTIVSPPDANRVFRPWTDGFNFGAIFNTGGIDYLALAATGVLDHEPCTNYNWFSIED